MLCFLCMAGGWHGPGAKDVTRWASSIIIRGDHQQTVQKLRMEPGEDAGLIQIRFLHVSYLFLCKPSLSLAPSHCSCGAMTWAVLWGTSAHKGSEPCSWLCLFVP